MPKIIRWLTVAIAILCAAYVGTALYFQRTNPRPVLDAA